MCPSSSRPLVATVLSIPRILHERATRPVSRSSLVNAPLPELERSERQERQDEGQDPEANDDLGLGPPLHLVVMVERRHAEDAPPGELEGGDLDDHGARLDDVDAPRSGAARARPWSAPRASR